MTQDTSAAGPETTGSTHDHEALATGCPVSGGYDAPPQPLGPDSLTWRYFGQWTGMLQGPWAGSMQNMHPQLGAAVQQHSIFFLERMPRLFRSVYPIGGVVFDGHRAPTTGAQVRDGRRCVAHDGGADPLTRRARAIDEFRVRRGGPRVVLATVLGPPLGEPLARVRQGSLHHLEGGDAAGPASGGQYATPTRDAPLLLDGVEQDERRVRDTDDCRERRLMWVMHQDGPCLRVDPLTQPRSVAGERKRSSGTRFCDTALEQQLPAE